MSFFYFKNGTEIYFKVGTKRHAVKIRRREKAFNLFFTEFKIEFVLTGSSKAFGIVEEVLKKSSGHIHDGGTSLKMWCQ